MRLLQLEMENFRSHANLDLDLEGIDCAAVIGQNGAGKSSILLAIEYALYGGSHDELLSRWGDKGGVRLLVEQGGKRWRVNRGRERGKKSWCIVEREEGEGFKPLPLHKIAETQEYIESAITGMDQDAFRASVYAPQGEVGVLASLGPGQRKALLGGLLGLDQYEGWREKAALESRGAHSEAESARERLGDLDERLHEAQMRFEDTDSLHKTATIMSEELADNEKALDEAIKRESAIEQVRRREQIVAQMQGVKESAAEAKQRQELRKIAKQQIAALEPAVKQLAGHEEQKAAHDEKVAQRSALERELRTQTDAVATCEYEGGTLTKFIEDVTAKIEEAKKPGARCPSCGQEIEGEHRAKAIAELDEELARHKAKRAEVSIAYKELSAKRDEASKRLAAAASSEFDEEGYTAAKESVRLRERAEVQLETLEGGPTVAELRERWATLKAEAEELPKEVPEGPTPTEARERLATNRQRMERLEEKLRADAAARKEAGELENLRKGLEMTVKDAEVDERAYSVVAKAFSRDGIPAMVLDNAVGGIEAATNETLEQLGVEMSVRLVTQRATKSGGLTETLDILVDDGTTEAALESFSGGEQARCHIALRLGLASVLSAGTGLELGCLLIDEVPDVDAAGIEMLAELLTHLPQQVILVSHAQELTAAMPQRIAVERSAGAASSVSVQ